MLIKYHSDSCDTLRITHHEKSIYSNPNGYLIRVNQLLIKNHQLFAIVCYLFLNPNFLQIEHLDWLGQVQGNPEISYHNSLPFEPTSAFQLDLERPKHSTNSIH